MNYHKDFKNERFHDHNLIRLAGILQTHQKNAILENFLGVDLGALGDFKRGRAKQDFDVLLEYDNYNLIIETKVDSAEGTYNNEPSHQTDRIYQKYSRKWKKKAIFLFITYGTAEYHIHKNEQGDFTNGPFSQHFRHLGCKEMKNLIINSIAACSIKDENITTWSRWLEFEIQKRKDRDAYLHDLDSFLGRYKSFLGLTDYPVNRMTLFAPEFTIPFYSELGQAWNGKNHPVIGRVSLGPVGRIYSTVSDSILNFNELWMNSEHAMTCNGLTEGGNLYFEFNEDFNLHLKCRVRVGNIAEIRAHILNNQDELSAGYSATVEYHKQGAYALFEWDLNLLRNSLDSNLKAIELIIENALRILK